MPFVKGHAKIAGRKRGVPNKAKLAVMEIAQEALGSVDQVAIWRKHIRHKDARVSIAALQYLSDRVAGKPAQAIVGDPEQPVPLVFKMLSVDW